MKNNIKKNTGGNKVKRYSVQFKRVLVDEFNNSQVSMLEDFIEATGIVDAHRTAMRMCYEINSQYDGLGYTVSYISPVSDDSRF